MSYNNAIPQSTNTLSQSQQDLLNNFAALKTLIDVNHGTFGSSNEGKHLKLSLPDNSSATFSAGEIGLFNKNASPTSIPDLWMARGTATAIPITGYKNGTVNGDFSAVAWTYLPSGLKIISGKNSTSSGTRTITFASTAGGGLDSFPGFSTFICYVSAIRIDNTSTSDTIMRVRAFTSTTATFGLANGSTDSTFFWTAMGL